MSDVTRDCPIDEKIDRDVDREFLADWVPEDEDDEGPVEFTLDW